MTERVRQSLLATLVCLTAAAVLLVFANGRWVWPPAAWLAPLFLLLFIESRPRVSGLSMDNDGRVVRQTAQTEVDPEVVSELSRELERLAQRRT